ncbi:MAG: ABC transporter ATP-binding protein [Planctomycetes bacterium]|nr:ABC transporter ATP-binding protein [Planctomycetota bacterium]
MLSVNNLTVSYGPVQALDDVSLNVALGELVCVLGPNSAGKSTLLRAISGQVAIHRGVIAYKDLMLHCTSAIEVARAGVIQCPEGRRLFTQLTVEENLHLGAARLGISFRHFHQDLDFLTSLFPVLRQRWHQKAGTLSGGEQQMVAIARSVIARPDVLLLDEPTLGLAPKVVGALMQTLPAIAERRVAVLVVEQNARAVLRVASRGYILIGGRLRHAGTTQQLQQFLHENAGYLG